MASNGEISGLLSNNLIYAVYFLIVFGNKTHARVHVAVVFRVSV